MPSERTAADPIRDAYHIHANQVAIRTIDQTLTYGELDERVQETVGRLQQQGVCAGDRFVVQSPTSLELCVVFWAVIRVGAVVCPVNPRWPASAVQQAAGQIDAQQLTVSPLALPLIRQPRWSQSSASQQSPDNSDRLATVVFTSGTTGHPKAVAHRLPAHLANARGANRNLPLHDADSWLLSLPLFHVAGMGILFRCAQAGASVAIPSQGQALPEAIMRLEPTHLSLIPTQLRQLLGSFASRPKPLRGILVGGAPLPQPTLDVALERGWPICTTYGLSEMASQVTATTVDRPIDLTTSGRCLAERELKIDQHDEILVRGAPLFAGYLQQDELTCPLDEAGWFATGDRGQIDEQGRLIVTGRRDNLFISGGENIYPEEIELHLTSLPDVRQAVVVPVPDQQFGERPVAFIDYAKEGGIPEAYWRLRLAELLPKFKIPDYFLPWQVSCGIKPNRRELADRAVKWLSRR